MPLHFLHDCNIVSDILECLELLPVHYSSWETAHRILRREASPHALAYSEGHTILAIASLQASTVRGVSKQGKQLSADMGFYPQIEGAAHWMLAAVAQYDSQVHCKSVVKEMLQMELSAKSDEVTLTHGAQHTHEIHRLMRELQCGEQVSTLRDRCRCI